MVNSASPAVLPPIDWNQPWLQAWREPGQRAACAVTAGVALHQALNAVQPAPVCFAPQCTLPSGEAYESYIARTRLCPTREGPHDFFNGLCWMRFPQTKRKLNQLQAAEIDAAGVAAVRGPVRDALTVFDENAAFLSAPQPLWDALLARDWHSLFITHRALWREAQLVLFGHALLEKLLTPRKAITAHVYLAQPPMGTIAELDAWVAADLSAGKLAGKPFAPLPVLGVPGWWPENENFSFYDDSLVFRPQRLS